MTITYDAYGYCLHCDSGVALPCKVREGMASLDVNDPQRYELLYHVNGRGKPCFGCGKPPDTLSSTS